jgi:superfamily II DNA or RNA helicase
MNLKIYSGAPGSGKTLSVINDVADTPGRYVIAVPRKELAERLDAKTRSATVKTIHSGQTDHREGVGRRIEEAVRDHAASAHCVLLITHEGLLGSDPRIRSRDTVS